MAEQSANLIYPMLAMVVLTATVLGVLFRSRVRAVRDGALRASFYRTFQGGAEPDYALRPARHFANLFEAPMLFYAACLAAMATRTGGATLLVLAWCYVLARLLHTVIHLGPNRLRFRIQAYFASWVVLVAMWFWVALEIATRRAAP